MRLTVGSLAALIILTAACTVKKKAGDGFIPPAPEAIAAAVARAPQPGRIPPGLQAELVDYVDLTDSADVHPLRSDGRSVIDTTACGPVRRTGTAANSFFALRFAVDQPYAPHLVVVEYPDDTTRMISLAVSEEGMDPRYNGTFHIETGILTGGRYPVSGRMRYHSFFLWPEKKWPTLICANQQPGVPAALSKIWVYRLTSLLPPIRIDETDTLEPRRIGLFLEDSRAVSFDFGRNDPRRWEHLFEYLDYCGLNLLSFDAMLYQWPKCKTTYLDGAEDDVARALERCEKHGVDFVAVFDPTANAEVDGHRTGDLTDPAVRSQWVDAVTGFVRKYGTHAALAGVSWGGPAGCARFNNAEQETLQLALYERLQAVAPEIGQYVFFGYRQLHNHYFMAPGHTPYDIISAWERGKKDFNTYLAWSLQRYRRDRGLNHWKYLYKKNLVPVRMSYPVDEECYSVYPGKRTGRPALFRDLQYRSEEDDVLKHASLPVAGCVWGTYFEQALYLDPAQQHAWQSRKFIAPQLMPGDDSYMQAVIAPLLQGDVTTLFLGGWHPLTTGHEDKIRRFAKAYRALPGRTFKTVSKPGAPVITRVLRRHGRCYFYFLNTTGSSLVVNARLNNLNDISWWISTNIFQIKRNNFAIRLEPYELAVFSANRGMSLRKIRSQLTKNDKNGIRERMAAYRILLDRADAAGLTLPKKYRDLYTRVQRHLGRREYVRAGALLGWTPPEEVAFRLNSRTGRSVITCPAAERTMRLDGLPDEWSGAPVIRLDREADLATQLQLPNHWTGPADYSMQVRAAAGDGHLYAQITVTDDHVLPGDRLVLHLSGTGYRSYADTAAYDTLITVPLDQTVKDARAGYAVMVTDTVTYCEIRLPRSLLSYIGAADTLGLVITAEDMDRPDFLNPDHGFARDNVLIWPRAAGLVDWWRDPRQCGLVIINGR